VSSNRIVIFGTGGFGRECLQVALDTARAANPGPDGTFPEIAGFLDDNAAKWGQIVNGYPVLGGIDWLRDQRDVSVVLGVGAPSVKRKIRERLDGMAVRVATLVHPSAIVGEQVTIGAGSVVCAGVIITTNIDIGECVTFNLGVTIGHDCRISTYCTFSPGSHVSGYVEAGPGCDFGTGSVIIQGKSVGEWSVIGAGAAVVSDLPPLCVAVGVPAKPIRFRESWDS
jgi:sugar O-acyltransferase (sialic acid O-acetyltransferase NeuD family)